MPVAPRIERVAALVPCHRTPPSEDLLRRIGARVDEVVVVDDGMPEPQAMELESVAGRVGAEMVAPGTSGPVSPGRPTTTVGADPAWTARR